MLICLTLSVSMWDWYYGWYRVICFQCLGIVLLSAVWRVSSDFVLVVISQYNGYILPQIWEFSNQIVLLLFVVLFFVKSMAFLSVIWTSKFSGSSYYFHCISYVPIYMSCFSMCCACVDVSLLSIRLHFLALPIISIVSCMFPYTRTCPVLVCVVHV
jgi:hypothetical protein